MDPDSTIFDIGNQNEKYIFYVKNGLAKFIIHPNVSKNDNQNQGQVIGLSNVRRVLG